jgi:hypothetical protein
LLIFSSALQITSIGQDMLEITHSTFALLDLTGTNLPGGQYKIGQYEFHLTKLSISLHLHWFSKQTTDFFSTRIHGE